MSDETQAITPYRAIKKYEAIVPYDRSAIFRKVGLWVVGIAVLLLVVGCVAFNQKPQGPKVGGTNAVITSVPTTTTATTWKKSLSNYGENRWFGDGITEIKSATTSTQAAEAAQVWLNRVKTDPNLLVAAANVILKKEVDPTTLFDKDDWATPAAVQLVAEMQLALATARIVPDNAPTDGINTGVSNGNVVSARAAGISGNRKAIRITMPDGRVVWVLARCGNTVTRGHSHFPPGKTDEKNPSQDPYPRGNASTGGGRNQNPGSGKFIPPADMVHPPATPRVNPPAIKPTTPPVGSTPDPTPAPPKEQPKDPVVPPTPAPAPGR